MLRCWRCRICGEVTFAAQRPSECPFCGSAADPNVSETDFQHTVPERESPGHLASSDADLVRASLKGELEDVARYRCLAKRAPQHAGVYLGLARVELEHAEIFADMIGGAAAAPALDEPSPDLLLSTAIIAEHAASLRYAEHAKQTENERLRTVFAALAAVENSHYLLLCALTRPATDQ